jgi:hypothetical protein
MNLGQIGGIEYKIKWSGWCTLKMASILEKKQLMQSFRLCVLETVYIFKMRKIGAL